MKVLMCVLLLVLALAPAAPAAEPVARTFNAPADRVWTVAEAVLKQLGWDIDKKDRTIGMIGTDARRVDGENWGVYAKGRRHRLTPRTHPVESVGDPGRRAPGDLLLHLHGAALARGRQQGVAADDAQLHHRCRPCAAPSGRAGDGAALDGHRLHRARRLP